MSTKKWFAALSVIVLVSMISTACAPSQPQTIIVTAPPVERTVVVTQEAAPVIETQVVNVTQVVTQTVGKEEYTTPHPILSNLKVRQAIAYCTDRDGAIAAVYPFLTPEERKGLRMDTNIPKTHWAYKGPYEPNYDYNPDKGKALLEEAGWKAQEGSDERTNDKGETLLLHLTTTNAQFRKTWVAVVEQSLKGCGITLIPNFTPASWWFGDTTGLARRDFELGAYAWVGEADPGGLTLYACNQIPLPSNNWVGQNSMGWCNKTASDAIIAANNSLVRADRIKYYDIFQKEFVKDMPSLPMFQRAEGDAWSLNLQGIKPDPTEYTVAGVKDWSMKDGSDTMVYGFSQEPASLFDLVESSAAQRVVAGLLGTMSDMNTQWNYDYQPDYQDPLSTVESGLTKDEAVDVKAGDTVWNSSGDPEKLAKGTKVLVNGQEVTWDGSSPLKLQQLTVTYKFRAGITWSDGTPVSAADLQLGYKIDCDKDSGATDFTSCNGTAKADFGPEMQAVVKYVPGFRYSLYFLYPWHIYPAHRDVTGGRKLADVPAKEWTTLPEIAEKPMGFGPYMITEWTKGQSIKLTVNPHFQPAPKIKNITIVIIEDTNQAVAQLLSGEVDYLDDSTLVGPELETVLKAAKEGKINAKVLASPTWEHIDFNLFTK